MGERYSCLIIQKPGSSTMESVMPVKNFVYSVLLAAGAILTGMTPLYAATVVQDTYVRQQDVPGTKKVNFADFDRNHDGQLSRVEIGEELFFIFDTDGNEVIDNLEYTKAMVVTIIPMEKSEVFSVDFNDDGVADEETYNYEEFVQ